MLSLNSGTMAPTLLCCACLFASPLLAQNVTNYPAIPDPLLLLLREPAVLDELQLDAAQRQAILQANAALDGPLLSSRNKPSQQSEQVPQWLAETRQQLKSTLTARQLQRLDQIRIRIRGYRALLDAQVAQQVGLNDRQQQKIEQLFEALGKDLEQLQQRAQKGESRDALSKEANGLQQDTQKKVVALLSNDQRQKFLALIGRPFEVGKLGQVRFQAPEFARADQWLNSQPMTMADLRGKVVALHFFAYG